MGDASLSVEFKVLGPFEVVRNGLVVPLGGGRRRLVLASLVAHANAIVSADRLIEIVWADEPPYSVLSTLQKYVYRLRGHLEGRLVSTNTAAARSNTETRRASAPVKSASRRSRLAKRSWA